MLPQFNLSIPNQFRPNKHSSFPELLSLATDVRGYHFLTRQLALP